MSKYCAIKNATNAYIRSNGRQEITGNILNSVLVATIDSLGKFFQFGGLATPDTDPGSDLDQNVAYIAGTEGIYSHLGNVSIEYGEIAVILFDGEWAKHTVCIVPAKVSDLVNDAGYITAAVADLLWYYTKQETDNLFYNKDEIATILTRYYDREEVDSIVDAMTGQSYIVSWEGNSAPDVTKIPDGVQVTWDGTVYSGTLAASDETLRNIYLVKNGGGYDEYITTRDSVYSWINIGTTAIDLSEYATKEEFDALKVYSDPVIDVNLTERAVNPSTLPVRNYIINADGEYGTSTSYKHSLVAVRPGQVLKVTANSEYSSYVSFLKTNAAPVAGGVPDFCDSWSHIYRVAVPSSQSQSFIAPSDAGYMYVYRGAQSTYPYTPSAISVYTTAFDNTIDTLSHATDENFIGTKILGDAVFEGGAYEKEVVDLASVPDQDLYILADNSFHSTGLHGMVYAKPGDVFKVVGGGGHVAFVSSISAPNDGSATNEIESMVLDAGKVYFLRAPAGAVGFLFNKMEGENAVNPSSIVRYFVEEDADFRMMNCSRFSASAGFLTYAAYNRTRNSLVKVKAGHTYFLNLTADTVTMTVRFIESIPYIGCPCETVTLTTYSTTVGVTHTITVTPVKDGYYLIRADKTGGPTLTVDVTDADGYTGADTTEMLSVETTRDFWRQNLYAHTLISRRIDGENGLYATSTAYKHILLPVTEGQYVKVLKGTNNARIAWYTEEDTPVSYGRPPYVAGTGLIVTEGGVFRVPATAKYLYVYAGDSSYTYWPSYIGVSVDYANMPDIVKENDFLRTQRILEQLVSTTRNENDANEKPLVLLHYSDIHGRKSCQNRINDFREYFKEYITDTIQTGDLVTSYWNDDSAYGDETDPDNNPCRDILSVIGNHDTASKSGNTFYWHTYQGVPAYNRYIKPYVQYWGVVQPAGAEENGYCFYYKDYPDASIRLVVLDVFDTDAAYKAYQQTWFSEVLEDARLNGYSVIVASHFRIKAEALLTTPFTNPFAAVENPDTSDSNVPYVGIVKDFIDAGGELVCWITGHSHYDAVSRTSEAQGLQVNVCVGNAGRFYSTATVIWETNSMIGVDPNDWKTFDLFNIMAVDTRYKTITLFRIGSNYDKMGRRIETTTIRYKVAEILYP